MALHHIEIILRKEVKIMNQSAMNYGKVLISVRKTSDFTVYATRVSKIPYVLITDLFDE